MVRWLAGASITVLASVLMPALARAQTDQQALVDRATLTVQEMVAGSPPDADIRRLVRQAHGVLICPRVFKAGFIVGGQGGGCVLVGRGQGGWSGPAFYGMGSGSVGLQIGIQDSEVMLIMLTERGFRALLDSQFKIGAGASLAFANVGAGVEGATTGAFNADIVAFQNNRGLFAGVSLDGALIGARSDWNQAYYGQPIAAQQIVVQMQGQNPGAAPLQEMLGRLADAPPYMAPPAPAPYAQAQPSYGQQQPYTPPSYARPSYAAPSYAAPPYAAPSYGSPSRGTVDAMPLAPPPPSR